MRFKVSLIVRMVVAALFITSWGCTAWSQEAESGSSAANILPDAPSTLLAQQQSQDPGPDAKLPESSKPEQNSAQTPTGYEQPKRILFIIPNYRAVSADAKVPPLDARGKFKLMVDDSFDYGTFLYVGVLAGLGMAQNSYPEFGYGASGFGQYYWHIFVDQAVGNAFTEWLLPIATKEDPRYFTKGHGGFFPRTGYAISRLAVTRTDSGGSQINFSEIIGNGAAAGISNLYYPSQTRTWTKTGQKWVEQIALDGVFNVVKEFWPDIRHSVLKQKN
jgi:hypothetical protein